MIQRGGGKSAFHQTEGDSLLCEGITLMTHFKELNS